MAPTLATAIALADEPSKVTEAEFLAVLNEEHPAWVALTDRLGAARAERKEAGLLANPDFGVEYEAPEGTTHQTTWTVAWAPPLDGRRGPRVDAAEAAESAARMELESERVDLRLALRAVYARWALAHEQRQVLAAHLAQVQRIATQMRARARAGEESGLTARRFELASLTVASQLARAEAEELESRGQALSWRPGLLPDSSPALPPLPELAQEIDLMGRPDLEAKKHELDAAEAQARLARRFLTFPELGIGWQHQDDQGQDFDGPTYAISWDVPLFNRQQADKLAADSRVAAAQARLDHATIRAQSELSAAKASYARLRLSALEIASAVQDTDTVIESAASSYRLGEASVTDLLETLASVVETRVAALDLYASTLTAHRNLEAAAGRPLTAPIGE